ncbi:hypothetical protein M2271_003478 [Streptomyces sp. LBL]|nr:hypothetical protein [Streptomyces sp. LBL]
MSPGPRGVEVRLSGGEFAELSRWVDGAVEPRLAERARIVLACAAGVPNSRAAADLKVTAGTVRKWRSRFVARRVAGLVDEPQPGRRKPELVLSEAERAELTRWARRAKTVQLLALRARIVLRCAKAGRTRRSPRNSVLWIPGSADRGCSAMFRAAGLLSVDMRP